MTSTTAEKMPAKDAKSIQRGVIVFDANASNDVRERLMYCERAAGFQVYEFADYAELWSKP